jgi:hypothetical protein
VKNLCYKTGNFNIRKDVVLYIGYIHKGEKKRKGIYVRGYDGEFNEHSEMSYLVTYTQDFQYV